MSDLKQHENRLSELNADLAALRGDLPELEALLEKRESELRNARANRAKLADLERLTAARDTIARLVADQRADLAEVEGAAAEEARILGELKRARAAAEAAERGRALMQEARDVEADIVQRMRADARRWAELRARINAEGSTSKDPGVHSYAWPERHNMHHFAEQAFDDLNRARIARSNQ